eukprot:gene12384-15576_t
MPTNANAYAGPSPASDRSTAGMFDTSMVTNSWLSRASIALIVGLVLSAPSEASRRLTVACLDISGYTTSPLVDHYGDDIGCWVGGQSAEVLGAKCDADATCQSFNTWGSNGGCIKNVAGPTAANGGVHCYYKKEGPAFCPDISGYTKTPLVDHDGDDIGCWVRGQSAEVLGAKCDADATCVSFNTWGSNGGCIKNVAGPTAANRGVHCYYKKEGPGCLSVTGYTVQHNMDHYGDDITCIQGATDAAEVATTCTSNPDCIAFNLVAGPKACLKRVTGSISANPSVPCYYTQLPSCLLVTGYTVQHEVDHWGDDITCILGATDMAELAATCTHNLACVAIALVSSDNKACLKSKAGPVAPNQAVPCFYSKIPVLSPPSPPPAPAVPTGNIIWAEEFNHCGPDSASCKNGLNLLNWGFSLGDGSIHGLDGWGNRELQCYTDAAANVQVDATRGYLTIKALSQPGKSCNNPGTSTSTRDYSSARIISKGRQSFLWGGSAQKPQPIKIEARIQIPIILGSWPAFWMLAERGAENPYGGWCSSGEIDIMEHVNLYLDGELYHTAYNTQWFSAYGGAPYGPFDRPFYILLNLAVGGQWPKNNIDMGSEGWEMLVDYVRVSYV